MATLRTLALAGIATMMFIYVMIFMIASYQISSGTPVNSTLKAQYFLIIGNPTNPGGNLFSNVSHLQTNTTNTIGALNNNYGIPIIGPIISFISSSFNIIGSLLTFVYDVPGLFYAIINIVAIPFSAILPPGYAIAMSYVMLIILILFAILSAIAIFPN